jgi:hypothetical protein
MYKKITRLSLLLSVFFFLLPVASSNASTTCNVTIDFSTHGQGSFDPTFYKNDGISFREGSGSGFFIGFIQGDDALQQSGQQNRPIGGTLIPPVSGLSVRLSPELQGTAEYTLTTFDSLGLSIDKHSVLVTQDTGDSQNSEFGYFTIDMKNLPRKAKTFILENRFIRSSFINNTFIPFGVGSISLCYSNPQMGRLDHHFSWKKWLQKGLHKILG